MRLTCTLNLRYFWFETFERKTESFKTRMNFKKIFEKTSNWHFVNHCVVLQFLWPEPAGYWKLGQDFRLGTYIFYCNVFYVLIPWYPTILNRLNIVKTHNSGLIRVPCQSNSPKSGYVNVSWKRWGITPPFGSTHSNSPHHETQYSAIKKIFQFKTTGSGNGVLIEPKRLSRCM